MSDRRRDLATSTPEASATVVQTRGAGSASEPVTEDRGGAAVRFEVGAGVRRASEVDPYERHKSDPLYRPLHIFTLDAASSKLEGAMARVNVPFEPLEPGPKGGVFEVDTCDGTHGLAYESLNLEDSRLVIRSGLSPTPTDHRFHLQMVYAVSSLVYNTFRAALGRIPAWGFEKAAGDDRARLRLRPFAKADDRNACYSRAGREVAFGYYKAGDEVRGRNMPGGTVFSALSHDIVAHEVTHALLDGLRAHFLVPSRPDVLGFHEGFADLVAYFLHFSYPEVVLSGIREARADLRRSPLLTQLARQFGQTSDREDDRYLRSAIEEGGDKRSEYDPALEPHALGNVLVNAVFDAFGTIFLRKTRRYLRLATGGTGILVPGDLPLDLQEILAEEASKLASQFLRIVIRAIDYCPPADLDFGEFLRAVITADYDLVPDDPWAYREAWIHAFARRRIYPRGVAALSEDALLWRGPEDELTIPGLSFAELRFSGDPARPAGPAELEDQARALGTFIARTERLTNFGLVQPGKHADPPTVQSVRTSRRIGPDGQVVFDLVAEVTQRQVASGPEGLWEIHGGSTVIVGPDGAIRYVVLTRGEKKERRASQRAYLTGQGGKFWEESNGVLRPRADLLQKLHQERAGASCVTL